MRAEPLTEAQIVAHIAETFAGVNQVEANGDFYFIYDPRRDLPPARQMPFATLVTGDRHDTASDLDRPGVYRFNVGISRETFHSLLGPLPAPSRDFAVLDTGHDYTALDRLMPHPIYGSMGWICVLSPTPETFERVRPLLDEAYERAVRRIERPSQDVSS
jgi:hypothetical protein